MILRVEADASGDTVTARVVAVADGEGAEMFDRTMLLGPNLAGPRGPLPLSAEPGFEDAAHNLVVLNPGCYYGRERSWSDLAAGEYEISAEIIDDGGEPVLSAESLRVTIS